MLKKFILCSGMVFFSFEMCYFDGISCWVIDAMGHKRLSHNVHNVLTASGGYSNWRQCHIMGGFLEKRGLLI